MLFKQQDIGAGYGLVLFRQQAIGAGYGLVLFRQQDITCTNGDQVI